MTAEDPEEPVALTDRDIVFCECGISLGYFGIDAVFDALKSPVSDHTSLLDILLQKQVISKTTADEISRVVSQDDTSTRYPPSWSETLAKLLIEARSGLSSLDTNGDENQADTLIEAESKDDNAYATLDPAATFIQPESSIRPGKTQVPLPSYAIEAQLGRFGILRLHAKGGLGQVSLAVDEELQREVALKEIQRQYADDAEARSRFVREAEITGRLEHPGVVPVYGLGFTEQGRPYYAMRFIQGRSLKAAIAEFHQMKEGAETRRLKFRELLRRVIDVCNTMQYAHSHRVIHRDLKPANIMVGEYGETLVVDWGLAKSLDEAEFEPAMKHRLPTRARPVSDTDTMDGIALGTPQYMSPEQASGKLSAVNSLSDIYSLGATLYHLLVGSPAFVGSELSNVLHSVRTGKFPAPREIRADVPPPLNSICLKAMALKPADRFSNALELAAEIERWLADEPVQVHGEGLAERWYRRLRRHRSWVMGVATMVPLLLLVLSTAAYFVNRERLEAIVQRDEAIDAKSKEAKHRLLAERSEKRAKEQETAAAKSAQEAGRALANLLITNAENAQAEPDLGAAALWAHQATASIDESQPELSNTHRIRLGRLIRPLPRPTNVQLMPLEVRELGVMHTFSPNGRWLIVSGAMPGAYAIHVNNGELIWPSLPDVRIMPLIAFSPKDDLLITGGTDSMIQLWDIATGKPAGAPVKLEGTITWGAKTSEVTIAMSADLQSLAASTSLADQSMQVECIDLSNPKSKRVAIPISEKVESIGFHPVNRELMVATNSGVSIFNSDTGEKLGESIGETDLWTASFSPNAATIVTASSSGYARLWDSVTRQQKGGRLDHRGPVTQAVFSPSGDKLITLSADRSARLWDVATGEAIGPPMEHLDRPLIARFSADGKAVATVTLEHKVYAWEIPSGRLLGGPWCHASVPDVTFAGDQLKVAVDGRCITWDLSRSKQQEAVDVVAPDKSHFFQLTSFLSASDKVLMTDPLHAWLVNPNTTPPSVQTCKFVESTSLHALSDNGKMLATVTAANEVQVWRLDAFDQGLSSPPDQNANFLVLQSTAKPNFKVMHLKLSRDGKQMLLADDTGKSQIWNTSTATQTVAEMVHDAMVRDSDFNADGTYVVTGSDDKQLRVWNATTGSLIGTPWQLGARSNSAMAVSCVQFHPNGKTIAAGSDSDEVVVCHPFEPSTNPSRFRLGGSVSEVRFSTDGRQLGAAGYSSSVSIWDWKNETLEATLPSSFIAKFQFSPDATFTATSSIAQFSLWETKTSRMLGPTLSLQTNSLQIDDKQRWLMTSRDSAKFWDITPDMRPIEDLDVLVRLLSMRTIDARGTLQYLSSEDIAALFDIVKEKHPMELASIESKRIELPDQ